MTAARADAMRKPLGAAIGARDEIDAFERIMRAAFAAA